MIGARWHVRTNRGRDRGRKQIPTGLPTAPAGELPPRAATHPHRRPASSATGRIFGHEMTHDGRFVWNNSRPRFVTFRGCQYTSRDFRSPKVTASCCPWDADTPADAMADDRMRCLQAGMNDYLAKPIRPDEVVAALARWKRSGAASTPQSSSDEIRPTAKAAPTCMQVASRSFADSMIRSTSMNGNTREDNSLSVDCN